MTGNAILQGACLVAVGLLLVAIFITVIRLVRGPNLGDRIMALDLITLLGTGFIGAIAVVTGFSLYIDIAIALALVSFLSTIALARYLLTKAGERKQTAGEGS